MKLGPRIDETQGKFVEEANQALSDFKNAFLSDLDPRYEEHYKKHFLDVLRYKYKQGVLEDVTLVWIIVFSAPNDNFNLLNKIWDKYQDLLKIEDFNISPKWGPFKEQSAFDLISFNSMPAYQFFSQKIKDKFNGKKSTMASSVVPVLPTTSASLFYPQAGIHAKYLGGTLPHMPHSSSPHAAPPPPFYNVLLPFISISSLKISKARPLKKTIGRLVSPYFTADFHSFRAGTINQGDRITFVCAGRGVNGLIPLFAHSRCVLVVTEPEYESLKNKLSPLIDVLVIKQLGSMTHGSYTALHSITCRRIAIFIFAHYFKLKHFMMADDNIEQVKFNVPSLPHKIDADELYGFMASHLGNAGCISIKTESPKAAIAGKLGSKLFMINMEKILSILPATKNMFLFFPNAAQSTHWGEDYYMQLMLYQMFNAEGYAEINSTLSSLLRSHKNRNSCAKSAYTAYYQHDTSLASLPSNQFTWVKNTMSMLNQIIQNNNKRYKKYKNDLEVANLLKKHAEANGVIKIPARPPKRNSAESFIVKFKKAINTHPLNSSFFRYYQIDTIKKIANLSDNTGRAILTTGAGKTRIQCLLALIAHAITNDNQSVIIVTPFVNLVKQFYQDMLRFNQLYTENAISPDEIITISCDSKSCNSNALLANKTILNQNAIMIFCRNSFDELLSANHPLLRNVKLLLLDEYQEYPSMVKRLMGFTLNDTMILGFSATPPQNDLFRNTLYTYTLTQGINDGVICPIIADNLGCDYSQENVLKLIDSLPEIIQNQYHPGFSDNKKLSETKGIIYLPSISLCEKAFEILKNRQIAVYCIHSNNSQHRAHLEEFLKSEKPAVALAVDMIQIGVDEKSLSWEIIAQNIKEFNHGHLVKAQQEIGRLVRPNPDKNCGYVLSFNNTHQRVIVPLLSQQKINFQLPHLYLTQENYYMLGNDCVFKIIPNRSLFVQGISPPRNPLLLHQYRLQTQDTSSYQCPNVQRNDQNSPRLCV